jgi:hypothetical protein
MTRPLYRPVERLRRLYNPHPGSVNVKRLISNRRYHWYRISDFVLGMLLVGVETDDIKAGQGGKYCTTFIRSMKVRKLWGNYGEPFLAPDGRVFKIKGVVLKEGGAGVDNLPVSNITLDDMTQHPVYEEWKAFIIDGGPGYAFPNGAVYGDGEEYGDEEDEVVDEEVDQEVDQEIDEDYEDEEDEELNEQVDEQVDEEIDEEEKVTRREITAKFAATMCTLSLTASEHSLSSSSPSSLSSCPWPSPPLQRQVPPPPIPLYKWRRSCKHTTQALLTECDLDCGEWIVWNGNGAAAPPLWTLLVWLFALGKG